MLRGASASVARWARDERPVVASALDLALRRLPVPTRRITFGLDEPVYLSVHTPYARLAPDGDGEVAHLLWYGDATDDPRARLDALLDHAQPGWRAEVVDLRYGHRLVVAHGRPLPGPRPRRSSPGRGARSARRVRGRRLGRPRRDARRRGVRQRPGRRARRGDDPGAGARVNGTDGGRRGVRGAPAPALRARVPDDRQRRRRGGRLPGRVVALAGGRPRRRRQRRGLPGAHGHAPRHRPVALGAPPQGDLRGPYLPEPLVVDDTAPSRRRQPSSPTR